jgi:hypothetical protein
MKKLFYTSLFLILGIMNLQAQSCFTPNWTGNGNDHMNFYITIATSNSVNLQIGDQIGVFDGDACVGRGTLTQILNGTNYLSIVASKDDPDTPAIDGYVTGHSVTFRFCVSSGTETISLVQAEYKTGSGTFSEGGIAEVELAGFDGSINIALNKTTTAQSYTYSEYGPSKANDADGTNSSFWAERQYPQWWKVDLGGVYDISGIVIRNYVDGYRYYQYTIEGSLDDQTYAQVAAKTNTNAATDAGDAYSVIATARYLRVTMTYNSENLGVHITDFRAYGNLNTSSRLITASAGTGGSISPSGEVAVTNGGSQTFTITSGVGYQISDVLVDGSSVGPVASYPFTNVTANHTISATFAALTNIALVKTATAQSYTYSEYGPSKANDADGTNSSFWAERQYPQWWKVDLGGVYNISGIVIRNYVDGSRYYQYTIEGSLDDQTYSKIAGKTNTNVATDAGDGYSVSTTARYLRLTMTYNSENHGVHITDFRAYGILNTSSRLITASAETGGSISPSGEVTVTNGGSQTFTITPGVGYQISDVLVDGGSVGAVTSYPFTNVTANHTISATFAAFTNIALNKNATAQSYTYSEYGPSKANDADGTNNSFWAERQYPQWWKVDLGGVYDISGIVIRNYVDGSRYYQYTIEGSLDDQNYGQIAAKTNTNVATDAGDGYSVTSTARYLRVTMTYNSENAGVHITDFRVYGTLPNIALNKNATAQSYTYSEYGPSKANDADGSNNSFWAERQYPQWWKVDLGGVYDISGIVIRNYVDGARYYQYVIEGSLDDQTYAQFAAKTNTNIATDAGDGYSVTATARYLRVTMTYNSSNPGVHITDFRAYGILNTSSRLITASAGSGGSISPSGEVAVTNGGSQTFTITPGVGYQMSDVLVDGSSVGPVTSYPFTNVTANHTISATFAPLTNIALDKPATSQSSTYPQYGPSKANDADGTNNSFWAERQYPQWWKVDLGGVYDISGIVIRNYVDGYRYYQYTIEGSLDDQTYSQVAGKTNTNVATDAGDGYFVTIQAQYLRVTMTYNSENPGVHITDFRVYGTGGSKGSNDTDSPLTKQDIKTGTDLGSIKLNVYPNPFRDQFTVRIDSPKEGLFNLSVIGLHGGTVYLKTEISGNTDNTFNPQLAKGIYILVVNNKDRRITYRMVKY